MLLAVGVSIGSSRSVASCPNVIVSSSKASAADEAGDGKSSNDVVSTLPLRAAAAADEPRSDELFINGADRRRRPVNISMQ